MLVFPNSKINLGLHVVSKRPDGYHNIETIFYPVEWNDMLEVIENNDTREPFIMLMGGIVVEGKIENNLIYRAWKIISAQKKIPAIKVFLFKNIPMGAGLGGGSSDAAHFIKLLDSKFKLGYTDSEKISIATQLGSDCAFFIKNKPVLALGKGDQFSETSVDLSDYYILLVYPDVHSHTGTAYNDVVPAVAMHHLKNTVEILPVEEWKNKLVNDFEPSIFKKYPLIKQLKESFYAQGALYASMSGSGSSVYGIYKAEPKIEFQERLKYFLQKPKTKIL